MQRAYEAPAPRAAHLCRRRGPAATARGSVRVRRARPPCAPARSRGQAAESQGLRARNRTAAGAARKRWASVRHAGDGAVRPALGHRQRRLGLPRGSSSCWCECCGEDAGSARGEGSRARAGRGRKVSSAPRSHPWPPPPPGDVGAAAVPVYRQAGRAQGHGAGPPPGRPALGLGRPAWSPPGAR